MPESDKPRILVVDDEENARESLRFALQDDYAVVTAENGEKGLEILVGEPFDLVILDLVMPDLSGIEVLERIRDLPEQPPVIVVSAIQILETAVRCVTRQGARDYLTKPFDVEDLLHRVERVLEDAALRDEVVRLRREVRDKFSPEGLVGRSPAMEELLRHVERVADTNSTVLLQGESGTGKELVARALHYGSRRADGPFIPVHCAAIQESLLESELFGHEKGAFTGAVQTKQGTFEQAAGGTLFLDEISETSLGVQARLLRVLQEKEFRRVGGTEILHTDARLVAATNRDLDEHVREGHFREDLFYRIKVVPIELPPLRDRREDIPLLIEHFQKLVADRVGTAPRPFTTQAAEAMEKYHWPGNVRQLQNVVERVMITAGGDQVTLDDLPETVVTGRAPTAAGSDGRIGIDPELSLDDAVRELETHLIKDALDKCNGVITSAAKHLGTTRRVLRYKMDKYGINSDGEDTVDDEAEGEEPSEGEQREGAA